MATIGIDLTPIQGPHRMRGVGSTVINVLRHLSSDDKKNHTFVFYLHKKDARKALELVNANSLSNYEVRTAPRALQPPPSIKTPRGILNLPARIHKMNQDRQLGDKRITETNDLDVFLQFEQDVIPPHIANAKVVVIAYDLIPYVLENEYLWSYKTARKTHNYSRRAALKAHIKRHLYISKIKSSMNQADKIIAISNHTKQDFVNYIGLPPAKINVIHLGVSDTDVAIHKKPSSIKRHIHTSWGDIKVKTKLPDTPFLLFVGGADPRRKLADLIYGFNLLRAQGHNIHLVLAGDTMNGPNSIPNEEARKALLSSSYLDDIYMLGFVDDNTREWLYQNALAFVYPSIYEGFGLPILEALSYCTPVITYRNSSIEEISKAAVLYADDFNKIASNVQSLILEDYGVTALKAKAVSQVNKFSWPRTAQRIIKASTDKV